MSRDYPGNARPVHNIIKVVNSLMEPLNGAGWHYLDTDD